MRWSSRKHSIEVLIMLVIGCILLTIPAFAAATGTHTPIDGVTVSVSGATNNSMSNGAITVTAKGSAGFFGVGASAKTATITISNNSDEKATVSFDWTATSVNQLTIDGTVCSGTSGSFSKAIDAGANFTVTITTAKNDTENKLVMSNFGIASGTKNVTFEHNGGDGTGTVTVDGVAVESGTTKSISTSGAKLVASPAIGATFMGWVDKDTGVIKSSDKSYTLQPTSDITVLAVFESPTTPAWFLADGKHWTDDLNDAVSVANRGTNKTVIQMSNGILPAGDYTIPSGVTLLIPYNDANTLCTTTPSIVENISSHVTPSAYRTLTMAPGAKITVNGAISVSGTVNTYQAGGRNGTPYGPQGYMKMESESEITVASGGKLYAWGFIYGSGTVTVKSGGTVYETFQVRDYRGGSVTSDMVNNDHRVFPMSQYYVQNVEVAMTLEYGAVEKGVFAVFVTLFGSRATEVPFIGISNCMFNLSSGSVTKWYDTETDRLVVTLNGTMKVSPYTFSVVVSSYGLGDIDVKIESAKYVLPINHNITLNIDENSTLYVAQDMALLPGAEINIAEKATCALTDGAQLFIYDADEWGGYCGEYDSVRKPLEYVASGTPKARAALSDAKIMVNGTADGSQGFVYTTTGGAGIYSTASGTVILKADNATTQTYQAKQSLEYPAISITPAKLKNRNGKYSETTNGTGIVTYTYDPDLGEWGGMAEVISNNKVEHRATTLAEAVAEYDTPADGKYIKMVHDSAVGANIEKTGTVLDLNGKNITGVVTVPAAVNNGDGTVTHGLYGMDSATDGYLEPTDANPDPYGSIVVSSGTVAPVTEFTGKNTTEKNYLDSGKNYTVSLHRYLAVKDAEDTEKGTSTWSFHRFNISVTDYYLEVLSTGTARIGFGATFRGDSTVQDKVTDMGFTVNGISEMAEETNLGTVADKYKLYYTVDTDEMGKNTAQALLVFDTATQRSDEQKVYFANRLKDYYYKIADEQFKAKAVIEAFDGKNTSFDLAANYDEEN